MPHTYHPVPPPGLWTGQGFHIAALVALVTLVFAAWQGLGRPVACAFWVAVLTPIVHQCWVWIAWRVELRSGAISRSIGFRGYQVVFFILFGSRFLTLGYLGYADQGSLGLGAPGVVLITTALLVPGLYAMYSVRRYFGMARAAGADHFDPIYRDLPLVKDGIFRFTNNGMYIYAFLLFWAIGTGFNSAAAIAVAAFSHAYIWVHFRATEKPDMDYIYGPGDD